MDVSDVNKHFIIITSHGRTATVWLSVALNCHQDFVCSHSNMTFAKTHLLPERLNLERVAHLRGKAADLSVDEYFDAQLAVAEAPYHASIHNYQVTGIEKRLENSKRSYKIINLIRHPITRFRSYADYIVEMKIWDHAVAHWMSSFQTPRPQSLVEFVDKHFDVDFSDYTNVAFIMAMSTMIVELDELQTDYPSIPVERLLSDRQYFVWFLKQITNGTCRVTPEYLDRVYAMGRHNKLRDADPLPVVDFEELPEWRRAVWRKVDHDHDIVNLYKPYGYDLSFIHETDFSWLST